MTTIQFTKHTAGHAPGTIQELSDRSAEIIIQLGFAVRVRRETTEKVEQQAVVEKVEHTVTTTKKKTVRRK